MGANTYRLMSGFAAQAEASETGEAPTDKDATSAERTNASKVVFSATLQPPLAWPNTRLVSGDAVEAVKRMKRESLDTTVIASEKTRHAGLNVFWPLGQFHTNNPKQFTIATGLSRRARYLRPAWINKTSQTTQRI